MNFSFFFFFYSKLLCLQAESLHSISPLLPKSLQEQPVSTPLLMGQPPYFLLPFQSSFSPTIFLEFSYHFLVTNVTKRLPILRLGRSKSLLVSLSLDSFGELDLLACLLFLGFYFSLSPGSLPKLLLIYGSLSELSLFTFARRIGLPQPHFSYYTFSYHDPFIPLTITLISMLLIF